MCVCTPPLPSHVGPFLVHCKPFKTQISNEIVQRKLLIGGSYSSTAASDCLVVSPFLCSQCHVVHAALGRGASSESLQNYVNDPLWSEDVATDHRGFFRRVQQRFLGYNYLDGLQAALTMDENRAESYVQRTHRSNKELPNDPDRLFSFNGLITRCYLVQRYVVTNDGPQAVNQRR